MNEQTQNYFADKKTFFVEKRKSEINGLVNSDVLTNETKIKLMCELKMLNLIDFYEKTKDKVLKVLAKP